MWKLAIGEPQGARAACPDEGDAWIINRAKEAVSRGWSIAPSGTRGIVVDAVAIYMNGPTCAVGFVARWCVPGDPPGFYDFRPDEPERRVPAPPHLAPGRGRPNPV